MGDNNYLDNGAVLPSGLLDHDLSADMSGFEKAYRNFAMRIGIVMNAYSANEDKNVSKLTTEYDVLVFEQNEDRGATTILYRNCMSADGLGSIADFFEKTLRKKKKQDNKGTPDLKGQNGAIVLLLCLDAVSDKAIVIGAFPHPKRKTTLTDSEPHLEGEYNGINIKVEADGSTTLTFKGATDNDGKVISDQGTTVLKIEKDGSYEMKHKTITQRFDKSGDAKLTADGDISNTTKKDYSVTATGGINLKATKDISAMCDKLTVEAQGSASFQVDGLKMVAKSEASIKAQQLQVEAQAMAMIKAPMITLDGLTFLGGAGGQPLLTLTAQMFGIGNLGLPVISTAISGFTLKTFAV